MSLWETYTRLDEPTTEPVPPGQFRVAQPGVGPHLVGIDSDGLVSILVECPQPGEAPPAYELKGVQAYYVPEADISLNGTLRTSSFVIVRCKEPDADSRRYFLSIWQVIADLMPAPPNMSDVLAGVDRLVELFGKNQVPAEETVTGLLGELIFIIAQKDVTEAVRAWHRSPKDQFDFVFNDWRLEVKTTTQARRRHTFSYEQTSAVENSYVASVFLQEADTGTSVIDMIGSVVSKCGEDSDLQIKVWSIVSGTLGMATSSIMERSIALQPTLASLQFYAMSDIPAIREQLPGGVSGVHFRADLEGTLPVAAPF
ncbi:MAG: PD-(D/E)XK motif protein [Propionibacteriaceae bacterium]|jgi:hypothetical protein|nr:PD-(D/E)XK motif protein [Propionibacteriaceae bacterium]